MPEILDHVAYLSQQIGPRPAGTEEEQQAALYITEQMQKEAGLSAVIEDFSGASSSDAPTAICCGATLLVGVLAMFLPVALIPATVVSIIAVLLLAAEAFDRPVLSKVFARGVSQNVVAKYEPGYTAESGGSRRRKIVLITRYDSGKVQAELNSPAIAILPIARWVNLGAMVVVPILLALRATVFLNATDTTAIVLNVLLGVGLVLAAFPLLGVLLHKLAAYNEGANCNAAGVAVLLDVARRVGRGRVSEAELAAREGDAVIHGEDAARSAGLVPEGAELVYAAANVKAPELAPQSEAERLAAAKAAVAALTGKPVTGRFSSDISENLVKIKEPPIPVPSDADFHSQRDTTREAFMTIPPETIQTALENAEEAQGEAGLQAEEGPEVAEVPSTFAATGVVSPVVPSDNGGSVPDWFRKAQEKAKKPKNEDAGEVHRSRYADALDAVDNEHDRMSGSGAEAQRPSAPAIALAANAGDALAENHAGLGFETEQYAGVEAAGSDQIAPESVDAVQAQGAEEVAAALQAAPVDGSTHAMPPLDVSSLRLGEVPAMKDLPLPAFLDPSKVQAEKIEARGEVSRTGNRVDVTSAQIDASGRIDIPVTQAETADAEEAAARRRPIVLPDIGLSAAPLTPITELQKQRAPLADVESSGKSAAKSLLTMLPSIDPLQADQDSSGEEEGAAPQAASAKPDLRAALPSLSGALPRPADSTVSAAGSFVPAGATGAFAPVGDELLENVAPEDIYVDDADDSAYDGEFTEMGAFAGNGYVEMPKSRTRRFFDKFRFRKNNGTEESSPQEWLEVDDGFDARSAGAARGGWESFREDEQQTGDYSEDFGSAEPYNAHEDQAADSFYGDDQFDPNDIDDFDDEDRRSRRNWNGGGFSRVRIDRASALSEDVAESAAESLAVHQTEPETPPELEQIYQFRNPDINTEVWFVALGSELAQHGGMHAFLAEHSQDLKGSVIIDLDALGAGELCMIDREGTYRKAKTSSRMKRYTKKASQATGVSISTASLLWGDSASSLAIKHGYQAMHLVGMDGMKPAFFGQGDDVLENIDGDTLSNNADFVMELLKNI